jgi:hypothetical protein
VILLAALLACPSADAPPVARPPSDTSIPVDTERPVDTAPEPPPEPARVELGPEVACGDPSARDRHGPLASPAGGGDWLTQPWRADNEELFQGGGLAIGDVDGDGRLDLLLPSPRGAGLYLQTAPLTFTEVSATHLPDPGRNATGALLVDLEGDGDLDAVIARYGEADSVWRNAGDGHFTDVTVELGIVRPPELRTTSPSAADVDRDGDLDLFIAGFGPFFAPLRPPGDPSWLWLQQADGTFVDGSSQLPPAIHDGYSFNGAWPDLNRDGWPDLYLVNDFGNHYPNRLVWNDAGTLRADDDAVGLDVRLQGMGFDWGDIDGDGGTDLVMAGWGNNRLMVEENGLWFAQQVGRGLEPDATRNQVVGWSTVFADLDHDLDLDIVEGFGHIFNQDTPPRQPDEIFLNDGGRFTPVGAAWGFDHPGQTRAVLPVDLDGDGWLDLARRDLIGPATLHVARCGEAAWSIVRLRDPTSRNLHAIGARVEAVLPSRTLWRDVVAGGTAVLAGGPSEVHFGLADHADVTLRVTWPDGLVTTHPNVPTRRVVTLTRELR